MRISTVGKTPLADPAQVIFSVADRYVGSWLGTTMSWLVLSSLFAGLLAFQNSAGRYFFAMGRAGVLPRRLDRVNPAGAPIAASVVTSVVTGAVIVLFAVAGLDPVLNLFYWFSGLAVVAIVLVEMLVSVAVIAHFRRTRDDTRVWHTLVAPVLSLVGLGIGEYLLVSRFGLLAGTVRDGVDPSTQSWGLNVKGWTLVLLPFVVLAVGWAVGQLRRGSENASALSDLVR